MHIPQILRVLQLNYTRFSQTHKVGNIGIIADFVFLRICSFLPYLHQLIVLNMKVEIKECVRITFKG